MVMRKRGLVDAADSEDEDRPSKLRKVQDGKKSISELSSRTLDLESLPDELLLRVFSFLTMDELMITQSVSRYIGALTKDSQLWKQLYCERFVYRRFGRSLKNVFPYRQYSKPNRSSAGRNGVDIKASMDWKSKYRLRHKWSNGSCNYREILLASEVLPQTLLCLRGSIAITADSECGLRAWKIRDREEILVTSTKICSTQGTNEDQPTALSAEINADQDKLHIAVGLHSGNIALYAFDLERQRFSEGQLCPGFMKQPTSTLSQAGHRYLLAMSEKQSVLLCDIDWARHDHPVRLISALKSQSSWKPVSVNLRVSSALLVASIIYAYPRFTTGWSVGLQELRWSVDTHELLSTRLATSLQTDSSALRTRMTSKTGYLPPTTTKPTSLCYSHPYLLATHPDNTLSLYMVRSTETDLSISLGMRLWGHTSDVYAASIGDRGKAVTVASGGDVRVWELEEGLTSASARKATPGPMVSVKLQPAASEEMLNNHYADARETSDTLPAAIDFDEERLVVLKNRGSHAQALFIYDFT